MIPAIHKTKATQKLTFSGRVPMPSKIRTTTLKLKDAIVEDTAMPKSVLFLSKSAHSSLERGGPVLPAVPWVLGQYLAKAKTIWKTQQIETIHNTPCADWNPPNAGTKTPAFRENIKTQVVVLQRACSLPYNAFSSFDTGYYCNSSSLASLKCAAKSLISNRMPLSWCVGGAPSPLWCVFVCSSGTTCMHGPCIQRCSSPHTFITLLWRYAVFCFPISASSPCGGWGFMGFIEKCILYERWHHILHFSCKFLVLVTDVMHARNFKSYLLHVSRKFRCRFLLSIVAALNIGRRWTLKWYLQPRKIHVLNPEIQKQRTYLVLIR